MTIISFVWWVLPPPPPPLPLPTPSRTPPSSSPFPPPPFLLLLSSPSYLSYYRQLSGASIKIANSDEGCSDRKVTIMGTPETINAAQYLINARCVIVGKTLSLYFSYPQMIYRPMQNLIFAFNQNHVSAFKVLLFHLQNIYLKDRAVE